MPEEKREKARELVMSSFPRRRFNLTERLFLITLYDENSKFWPTMEALVEINKEFPVKPI